MTLQELEKLVAEQNPKPLFKIVNDQQIELSDEEYKESVKNRALMLHQQQNPELYSTDNA